MCFEHFVSWRETTYSEGRKIETLQVLDKIYRGEELNDGTVNWVEIRRVFRLGGNVSGRRVCCEGGMGAEQVNSP